MVFSMEASNMDHVILEQQLKDEQIATEAGKMLVLKKEILIALIRVMPMQHRHIHVDQKAITAVLTIKSSHVHHSHQ